MKITFLSGSLLLFSFGLFAQTEVWRYSDTLMGIYNAFNMSIDSKANIYAAGPAIDNNINQGVPNASIVFKLDSSGVYHWSQGFVNGNYNNIYYSMAGDTLGNTYICGEFNDSLTFNFDAYLTHIDSSGHLIWNEEYDDAGYYNAYNDVQVDKAGNVWVAGTSNDINFDQGMTSSKFTATDSAPTWRKFYYNINNPTFYNSYFPIGDNAGGMFNLGQAAFGEAANSIVLLKYSSAGVFSWFKVMNSNPYSDEEPASANADSLGNLYIADNSAPGLVNYNYVPYLIKMNLGGIIQWKTLFGDTSNDYYLLASALDTSGFYIAGSRNDSVYLAKISLSTGDTMWTFLYPGNAGTINKLTLKNGSVYGAGVIENDSGSTSFITLKLTKKNGYLVWEVTYDDSLNGSDAANDIVADNSGNIYVAGQSFQTAGSSGSATVIKYHDDQFGCTLVIDSMVTVNSTSNLTSDGSASVVVSGGTIPYYYNWSTGASTDTITGLASNTYCVTVTDSIGCIAILCDSVKSTTLICDLSIDSVEVSNVGPCYGENNGIIVVYTSGAIGPLSSSVDNGVTYMLGGTAYNLSAGIYNIKVKDAHNCTATYSGNPVRVSQPYADTPTITIKGDTLSTGLYVEYEWIFNGNPDDSEQTFIIDSAGTAFVYVLDTNDCVYVSDTVTVSPTSECQLAIDSVAYSNVYPCYNGGNGSITVLTSGGVGQISYSIDNGIAFQDDSAFSKLQPGINYIEVKDANDCKVYYSANPVTITQPAADTPTVSYSEDTLSTGLYTHYAWYYNSAVIDTSPFLVVDQDTFCGNIYVRVTDDIGCSFNSSPFYNICEGINSMSNSKIELTIYPNPFNETLNISLDGNYTGGDAQVELFDMLGQKLYDDRTAGNTFSISTSGFAQGMYLLRVDADGQFLYRQVVKQ